MGHPAITFTLPSEDLPPVVAAEEMAQVIELPVDPEPVLDEPEPPAAEPHVCTIECSPLHPHYGVKERWHRGTRWTGEIVTDPGEVAAIAARIEAAQRRERTTWGRLRTWLEA